MARWDGQTTCPECEVDGCPCLPGEGFSLVPTITLDALRQLVATWRQSAWSIEAHAAPDERGAFTSARVRRSLADQLEAVLPKEA